MHCDQRSRAIPDCIPIGRRGPTLLQDLASWLSRVALAIAIPALTAPAVVAQAPEPTGNRGTAKSASAEASAVPADVATNNAAAQQDASSGRPEAAETPAGSRRGAADRGTTRPGIPTTPLEIFLAMGVWGIPFVIASVVAVWFTVERLVVLRRGRVIPRDFVDRFLSQLRAGQLDQAAALQACEESGSPVAVIFAHGVRKWGKPSVEVEQAIIDGGERETARLRRHLRVLNGTATVTPLFGLLGTVVGMIRAFNGLATAGVAERPEQLAVGIALALLTTACGLAVAIPSLIAYIYFTGRVDTLVMEMDALAQQVVQLVSAEGLAQRPPAGRPIEPSADAAVPSDEQLTQASP